MRYSKLQLELIRGFMNWRMGQNVPVSQFHCYHDARNMKAAQRIGGVRKGLVVAWQQECTNNRDDRGPCVYVVSFSKRKFREWYLPVVVLLELTQSQREEG